MKSPNLGLQKRGNLRTDAIAENAMFRITVVEGATEDKWILQGQLTGEFASELSANWQSSQCQCSGRARVVDLTDVTAIDKSGEEVLFKMMQQRTTFVATGLYTRHLLNELKARIECGQTADL